MSEATATKLDQNEETESRLEALKGQELDFLIARCKTAVGKLQQGEKDRQSVNATMQAEREALEALGITKKALSLALQVSKMDDDALDGFWLALQILLKAIEKPIKADELQADLFE
ncbi:MAG: hypothetical protein KJN67_05095 [Pontiella sp.]|nr:hypothetical protein [Pontiella sp.]